VSEEISSEMKSVGEVMALGRSFEEALQKGLRMIMVGAFGLEADHLFFRSRQGHFGAHATPYLRLGESGR